MQTLCAWSSQKFYHHLIGVSVSVIFIMLGVNYLEGQLYWVMETKGKTL